MTLPKTRRWRYRPPTQHSPIGAWPCTPPTPRHSKAVFGARAERLDFSDERSVDHINAWVAEATNGAIPELVSRLGSDDGLVLANAMRFEGEWAQRFDPERTVSAPFHLRTGAAPEVPTMHADDLPARYREDGDLQAVALPYGGGDFELVAVLPRAGVEAPEALRRLAADPSWLGGRGFHEARGTLALPRLDLDVETSLLPALRALGLGAALDDRQAFAGIAAPAPELSRVLQPRDARSRRARDGGRRRNRSGHGGGDHRQLLRDARGPALRARGAPPQHRRPPVHGLGR